MENENSKSSVALVKDDYILVNTFENRNIVLKTTNKNRELVVGGII